MEWMAELWQEWMELPRSHKIWILVGLGGQLMFFGRFLVQWVASERARRSVIPASFWFLSIAGGAILLAYAIHQRDPVFILGQSMGVLIYSRNIYFIHRERKRARKRAMKAIEGESA